MNPAPAPSHLAFFGTTTGTAGGGRGIYSVRLDGATGQFSPAVLAAEVSHPSYVIASADHRRLFCVGDTPTLALGFKLDAAAGTLTALPAVISTAHPPASHIALDATGRMLICVHYHEGYVAGIAVGADGAPVNPPACTVAHSGHGPNASRQEKPHPHSTSFSPDNRFAYVCDLGVDKIYCYRVDPATAALTPAETPFIATPPGSGPRHSVISADGRFLHVITELACTIEVYACDPASGALTHRQSLSTLPAGFSGENITAEIRLHPSGRFLYGSNRGHDSIAVYARDAASGALTTVEIVPCGGRHPRNFSLTPDGAWLVTANRDTDNLASLRVDPASGRLTLIGQTALPKPLCGVFVS